MAEDEKIRNCVNVLGNKDCNWSSWLSSLELLQAAITYEEDLDREVVGWDEAKAEIHVR